VYSTTNTTTSSSTTTLTTVEILPKKRGLIPAQSKFSVLQNLKISLGEKNRIQGKKFSLGQIGLEVSLINNPHFICRSKIISTAIPYQDILSYPSQEQIYSKFCCLLFNTEHNYHKFSEN
jgi:hypothetical protein